MKKYLYYLIPLLAFLPVSALAGDVNPGQALEIAKKFMKDKTFSFDRKMMDGDASERGFYAFNAEEGGFVLVCADDRASRSVLGYSKEGSFNYSQLPENARAFFDGLTSQIKALTDADAGSGSKVTDGTVVEPLIQTRWGQEAPFNNLCPMIGADRCLAGCVATAMAQIMYYHQWPNKGNGVATYSWGENTLSQNLSKSVYDYSSMTTTYNYDANGAAADAVATLVRDCGYAVSMNYTTMVSTSYLRPEVLYYDFGYKMATLYDRNECGLLADEWDALIMAELQAGRPVLYSGHNDGGTGGHQFILDGCDADGLFHFNFGWNGMDDDYYGTTGLEFDRHDFNYYQEMIVGIEPDRTRTPATTIPATFPVYAGYYDSSNTFETGDPTVKIGESIKIITSIYPNTATNKALEWTVDDTDAITVSSDGTVKGILNGTFTVAARPKGSTGAYTVLCEVTVTGTPPPPVAVTGLKLNKNTLPLIVGNSQKLTHTITPSNATIKKVTWTSSDEDIATVEQDGTVTAVSPGTAIITVTSQADDTKYDECEVTVSPVPVTSLSLNKTSLTIMYPGGTETLTPTIKPDEALKEVTWTSSAPDIVSVDENGMLTTLAIGTATITCTSNVTPAKKATCKVTVKTDEKLVTGVKLDQTTLMIKDNGEAFKLNATVTPDDAYDKTVKWTSSNEAVATVDDDGNVRGVSIGTATITCQSAFVPAKKATCKVTVVDKNKVLAVTGLKLDKTSLTIKQLRMGSVSDPATVTSSEMFTELRLLPEDLGVLTAIITPAAADDKDDLTWEISNPNVAVIIPVNSNTVYIWGKEIGNATITCKTSNGKKATCKLIVKDWRVPVSSVKIEEESRTTTDLTCTVNLKAIVGPDDATDKDVEWSVNNTTSASVTKTSDDQATVSLYGPGTYTVTCTSTSTPSKKATYKITWKSPLKAVSKVTLSKTSVTINDYDDTRETFTLRATVTPDDAGRKSVKWTVSDESAILCTSYSDEEFTFGGLKGGTYTITCTSVWTPSKKATCRVTVKSTKKPVTSVKLDKTTLTLAIDGSYDLTPTILPIDAYSDAVIWTSSNTGVATVDNGHVVGVTAGTATITCQSVFTPTRKATCKVTVKKNAVTDAGDDADDAVTRGVIEKDDETFAEGADEAVKTFDVFDLQGRKVASQVTSLDGLPKGVYIVDGKKLFKR